MSIPADYLERVYAGVLGKLIGVYLGRPFEGWSFERIMAELGPIEYYVHQRRNMPLVVTDDDISGTFTFVRALEDYGYAHELTPAQIGRTWLNYIIEQRTILWWGGLGNSTEHTAFLRLKQGVPAPESGSAALNGTVVAEQIGAQIFIDGWAMVAPGDPELAADLARRAASVSHDGEAIYGAQALAAMEALAFVEHDTERLLDAALEVIPPDSIIARLHHDLREWRGRDEDWQLTRERIVERYGYDTYGGNCHMVPNHALILLGLLYGEDELQRSLLICNTAGWDTDCNSGNLGCLLGIKNGLAGLDAGPDWRGPIADRLYLPTADGGRAITDAVTETLHVVNAGRALAGQAPLKPKGGARYHWELPGSVQGWESGDSTLRLVNVAGHSRRGARSLALRYELPAPGSAVRASTPTFIPSDMLNAGGYELLASPSLYPAQTLRAGLEAGAENGEPITCRLFMEAYGDDDGLHRHYGPEAVLEPGRRWEAEWKLPDPDGQPIARIGVELLGENQTSGSVYLDYLGWDGTPELVLRRPSAGGKVWRRAWINGIDHFDRWWPEALRLVQDRGRGLISQGTRQWTDYSAETTITPHMAEAVGIAVRVQGMQRFYALLLRDRCTIQLVRALDGDRVLAEVDFAWQYGQAYDLRLEAVGSRLRGWIDGTLLFELEDRDTPLLCGAVGLLIEEGRAATDSVSVRPVAA